MAEDLMRLPELMHTSETDLRTYSPLTLAWLGDAVYELVVRTALIKRGNCPVNTLNRIACSMVKASAQSALAGTIEPILGEEEAAVYRRGRNAHSPTMAKNATMSDYRRATGLEALVGYLYLQGKLERILELLDAGLDLSETNNPVNAGKGKGNKSDGRPD